MNHDQFEVGQDFFCGDHKWRCTDKGSRVIVAIQIDEVKTNLNNKGLNYTEATRTGWFRGPPYAVVERVFDEDSQQACHKTKK